MLMSWCFDVLVSWCLDVNELVRWCIDCRASCSVKVLGLNFDKVVFLILSFDKTCALELKSVRNHFLIANMLVYIVAGGICLFLMMGMAVFGYRILNNVINQVKALREQVSLTQTHPQVVATVDQLLNHYLAQGVADEDEAEEAVEAVEAVETEAGLTSHMRFLEEMPSAKTASLPPIFVAPQPLEIQPLAASSAVVQPVIVPTQHVYASTHIN